MQAEPIALIRRQGRYSYYLNLKEKLQYLPERILNCAFSSYKGLQYNVGHLFLNTTKNGGRYLIASLVRTLAATYSKFHSVRVATDTHA